MASPITYVYQIEQEGKIHELDLDEETFKRVETDQKFADDFVNNALARRKINERREAAETYIKGGKPNHEMELSESKETQLTWHYNMVIFLIKSMEVHHENLSHPKKRKNVFENISNDMLSQGFSVNSNMVQNKWKSLVRSYKVNKDNKNRPGRAPSRFMYFDEMDAILGNKYPYALESSQIVDEGSNTCSELVPPIDVKLSPSTSSTSIDRKRSFEDIKEENKMIRHREKMEIEKQKIEIEKEKIKVLEKYLQHVEKKICFSSLLAHSMILDQ